MNFRAAPPRSACGFRTLYFAGAVLALGGMPGCLLAYRPAETAPTSDATQAPLRTGPTSPAEEEPSAFEDEGLPEGVFHVVQAGQTLWRIARGYGVPVETIVVVNGIADPDSIEIGRALFVPGARSTRDIAPYPAPPPAPALPDDPTARNGSREWMWPLPGEVLSRFGAKRRSHVHRGVDIRGRRGENVVAARAGRVVFAGRGGGGYGLTVVIDHADGHQSLYAHNESLVVGVGDAVEQGEPIARCGRSGNATTEHVHFEIRKDAVPRDPLPLLGEVLEARR